jgi:hypothetical protein
MLKRGTTVKKTACVTLWAVLAAAAIGFTGCPTPQEDTTPPAEIGNLKSLAESTIVALTWTDPPDVDFVSVEISWSPGGSGTLSIEKGALQASITGLSDGTAYTCTLKTVDAAGNKSAGSSVIATPCAVMYVKTDGSDANPGTRDLPKKTIQPIIDAAVPVEIRVAAGAYTETISMQDGFSLKGGYSATNWFDRGYLTSAERSSTQYKTEIIAPAEDAVWCVTTVTSSTLVEGLTITAGSTGNNTRGLII